MTSLLVVFLVVLLVLLVLLVFLVLVILLLLLLLVFLVLLLAAIVVVVGRLPGGLIGCMYEWGASFLSVSIYWIGTENFCLCSKWQSRVDGR